MDRRDPDLELPIKLGPCSNGEFWPTPLTAVEAETIRRTREEADREARRLGISRRRFLRSVAGAALMLGILDATNRDAAGAAPGGRYRLPPDAGGDLDAARSAIGGDEFIFDVQSHYLNYDLDAAGGTGIERLFPQQNCGEEDPRACFSADHFVEEMFLKSDTSIVVMSAIPIPGEANPLAIDDMELVKKTMTELCGRGRVLLHGGILPSVGDPQAALDGMRELRDDHAIGAWKVYTHAGGPPWWLDDHEPGVAQVGSAFLEQVREVGPKMVCVHKGFGSISPDANEYASPVDVGPAAAANPDIDFIVYHSGFEQAREEGPYTAETADVGVNRLITSARAAGIGKGANIYAELGSTWRAVMSDPEVAAHVLGKLLAEFGPDNVVWGTDSIWYGSPQDQIQAFRAFEITPEFQERYGYPELTPKVKRKILGRNSARLYGVEPRVRQCDFTREELEEVRHALPTGMRTYGPTTAAALRAHIAAHGVV
ncbi:MAG TPA: amidohydrolase family protein [Acidimicrobiia bacterium]